jgi:hypothetical protein
MTYFSKSVNTNDAEFLDFVRKYLSCQAKRFSTLTGALTNKVTARTKVPPSVHQTLKVLILPTPFVPKVLMIPERMFTPHAMAVTSTRVNGRPWPTSAREAINNATLEE